MDEMERRLRAVMAGAAEQAPPGLLDRVYRRHRRHRRRALAGYLAVAAALVFAVPLAGHELSGREPPSEPAAGSSVTPGPPSASPAAPGTLLLTCNDANWGQLESNWRASSLRAGPLWFASARLDGYVHDSSFRLHGHATHLRGIRGDDVMIVEVADGSTVTMKPAPEARAYFRFFDGFSGSTPNNLPPGDTGFTFSACPRGDTGPNGPVTDFYLGFFIKAGRAVPVDISGRAPAPQIRVIFTCPRRPSPCG